ncbi:MAG: cell division ATPase MinD [Hadesarchaea archaeon]|nr:cell division ATPase MinD [Hadesarchaea archaeon]MDH5685605.1 cell division ATPase MinD [Hadesarchaea archaeon]
MRRIVLGSGKGGVGRSTLTANLGLAIAKMGKTAIVLDASLTTPNLGAMFKLEKVPYTLNDVLAGEIPLSDVIYRGPAGLKIIPAGVTLSQVKKALPNRLPEVLNELPIKAEFLLIDAPGGLRRETVAALRAGQEVLLVTLPEISAVSGMMKTRLIADFFGLKPIGIVINRILKEEFELTSLEIGHLLDLPVLAEVPEDVNIKKAFNLGKIAVDASPNSPASKAINALAKKLVEMKTRKSKA